MYSAYVSPSSVPELIHKSPRYRFAPELARFPSSRFYEGKLGTGTDTSNLDRKLSSTNFPWPKLSGKMIPNVFVPCFALEDFGGQSKQNEGQAKLVAYIVKLLRPSDVSKAIEPPLTIAVLTPYTKQVKCLKNYISGQAIISTIDGFQGREADFVVYSSVRCNTSYDIGFLMDERRLNVAWTRARVARIVVGDPKTLKFGKSIVSSGQDPEKVDPQPVENELWTKAIEDCSLVTLDLPEEQS
jgi:superfamily I DNA and/or RNA helicase